MVIENTVPATPIVDDATAPSNVRAPVAPPLYSQGLSISHCGTQSLLSMATSATPARMPSKTAAPGSSQNVSPSAVANFRMWAVT